MKKKLITGLAMGLFVFGIAGSASATGFTFFEAPAVGGYLAWNDPGNISTHDAWLAAVGENSDYSENFEGNGWSNGDVFDSQVTSTAFGGGATFSNVGAPDPNWYAYASDGSANALGGSRPIGNLSWRSNGNVDATINFGSGGADYLGFYIFDTDHPPATKVTYNVQYTDGTIESIVGGDAYQNRYLFVGFVNNLDTASFERFWIDGVATSRYGIDELEWGSSTVPEPATMILFGIGIAGLVGIRIRRK